MATETKDFATDMFTQATESFRKTMDAGLKVQEQFTKMFAAPLTNTANPFEDMRKRGERFSNDYLAMVEKTVQQGQKTLEDQSRTSMEMLRKAFDTAKGQTPADMQARTQELWQTSLDSVRSYTDAMVKTNHQMMETWTSMMGSAFNGHENGKPTPTQASGTTFKK